MDLSKKAKTIGLIFYILAGLFLIYTIFTIVQVIMYLGSIESSGMYVQIGIMDKISYFVTQVGPVIFYTCGLFGLGYIIQLLGGEKKTETQEIFPRPSVETETKTEEPEETVSESETEGEFVPNPPVSFDEIDVLDLGSETEEAEAEAVEETEEPVVEITEEVEVTEEPEVEIDELDATISYIDTDSEDE